MTKIQKVVALLVFALTLGLLFPYINKFAYPLQSSYSDVTISHYPNLVYLQQSLVTWKEIPLWSSSILSGYPFSANPLSGLWYPPLWVAVIFHGATGLNLVVMLHLFLGSYGMFIFLREEGFSFEVALIGGVAFQMMPKVHAHYAAGHITMVCAVMWTPWLLWVQKKSHGGRKGFDTAVLSGLVLGFIALADLRWAAYAGALWFAYNAYLFGNAGLRDFRKNGEPQWKTIGQWCLRVCLAILLALAITAPQLVPLLRYSPQTTRSLLTPADNLAFALPLERLINVLFPDIGGYAEWVIYPGALMLILFVGALVDKSIWKKRSFWLVVFGVSGLYAIGHVFILNRFVARLPGFSLLRVPSRAVFISNLAVIVIACEGLAGILRLPETGLQTNRKKIKVLAASAMVMIAVLLSTGLWILVGEIPFELMYGSIVLILSFILFVLFVQGKIKYHIGIPVLIAILVLDLGTINHCGTDYWSFTKAEKQGEDAAVYLSRQKGKFRVYSPSYSLPQHTAALYGLELADGIDPLQLQVYAEYMQEATGVSVPGYSVTIPAFQGGQIDRDNMGAVPSAELLGKLNVRFVVAEFDISAPALLPVARFGETRIYENLAALPRMWIQSAGEILDGEILPVADLVVEPNQIHARADGPGLVVASEVMYKGWQVKVDGQPEKIQTVDGLFRGVEIPSGTHEIFFYYLPADVYIGFGIGLAAWMIAGLYFFFSRRKQTV